MRLSNVVRAYEPLHFVRELPKFDFLSKKSHLLLDMAEQDAITPLASGANQPPGAPQGSFFDAKHGCPDSSVGRAAD
ncbi:hypothetical protein CCGE531_16425 [Rhizobium sp. CCGE531]|nr:hypothetical protein CCGE531_16425 [Rhizobium sp. CCGE531]AYG73829.1 hypothetical protein CCGE532_15930 [Rhizobium sp. CCGE532]